MYFVHTVVISVGQNDGNVIHVVVAIESRQYLEGHVSEVLRFVIKLLSRLL